MGTIAFMYVSVVMLMDWTYPLLTSPNARTDEKNMCHMVRVIGSAEYVKHNLSKLSL